MFKKFIIFCLLLAIAAAGAFYYVKQETAAYLAQPLQIQETEFVDVQSGMNLPKLLTMLEAEGKITPSPFKPVMRFLAPEYTNIKVGTFQATNEMSLADLLAIIVKGVGHQFSIRFVEGSTFKQWREILKQDTTLIDKTSQMSEAQIAKALGVEYDNLEGMLLPETYHYTKGMSDLDVLQRAADSLKAELELQWQDKAENLPLNSPYEVLILASIIEKETAVDAERTQVASVFVNRLNKKMKLQTDPTVIYGMGDKYQGNIRRSDLREATPYNTYVIDGLPPTPIAMVSKKSIYAATHPDKTDFIYFVASGTGGHVFSKTLAEHNRAVQNYLKVLRSQK